MKKLQKAKLNGKYELQLCSAETQGALNAFTFESNNEWVLIKDNGVRYATRYTFTTLYAKENKFYFECGTSSGAIQQVIISLNQNKIGKLSEIYFVIIDTGKEVAPLSEDEDEEKMEEFEEEG